LVRATACAERVIAAEQGEMQNYFIGAACNVKRWLRREAWKLKQAAALRRAYQCDSQLSSKQLSKCRKLPRGGFLSAFGRHSREFSDR